MQLSLTERRATLDAEDGWYRGAPAADIAVRAADDPESRLVDITFARFNVWTHIRSYWEGEFLETIERGAFVDTFRERRHLIRCLFDHGYDPVCGDKPLGPIRELYEGDVGPVSTVDFLDRPYADDILAGIREDVYGASYRFGVVREEWNEEPGEADHNPRGLPERRLIQLRVAEDGPVAFPADEGTQGLVVARSLTDHFRSKQQRNPIRRNDVAAAPARAQEPTPSDERAMVATAFANRHRR